MIRLLRQPYPVEEPASRAWLRAALVGGFVGLFLLTFQPFGLDQWPTPHKAVKLLGFGMVSFALTAFNFLVWPRLFPQVFREDTWTVGKAILFITANILLIAVGNRLYLAWLADSMLGLPDLGSMVLITFLVGIFPTAGAVIASYIIRLRRYVRQAADLPVYAGGPTEPSSFAPLIGSDESLRVTASLPAATVVTLTADNEKDQITVDRSDLLYIESSDNYCTIVYLKNGQPVRPLLRSSLSRLEGQIDQPHPVRNPFVRCHRSYVVNLDWVERVTGNAQGYKLHLFGGQFQVPVARKYNDSLVSQLKT